MLLRPRHSSVLIFIVIQDSVPGALTVDMSCQEGQFMMDNVSFYRDGKLATELTAEADWKRRGLYMGPQVRRYALSSES